MRIGNEKNQRAPSFCPPSFVSSFLALPFWSNSSVLLPKLPPSSGLDMLMQSPQTLSPSVWPKLNRLTAAPWSSGCKTEQEELEQSTDPLCLLTIWAQSQYCTLTSSLTVTLLTYPMMFYRKLDYFVFTYLLSLDYWRYSLTIDRKNAHFECLVLMFQWSQNVCLSHQGTVALERTSQITVQKLHQFMFHVLWRKYRSDSCTCR